MDEERLYARWTSQDPQGHRPDLGEVDLQTGILGAKLALNRLHRELAEQDFTQVLMRHTHTNTLHTLHTHTHTHTHKNITHHTSQTHTPYTYVTHTFQPWVMRAPL